MNSKFKLILVNFFAIVCGALVSCGNNDEPKVPNTASEFFVSIDFMTTEDMSAANALIRDKTIVHTHDYWCFDDHSGKGVQCTLSVTDFFRYYGNILSYPPKPGHYKNDGLCPGVSLNGDKLSCSVVELTQDSILKVYKCNITHEQYLNDFIYTFWSFYGGSEFGTLYYVSKLPTEYIYFKYDNKYIVNDDMFFTREGDQLIRGGSRTTFKKFTPILK